MLCVDLLRYTGLIMPYKEVVLSIERLQGSTPGISQSHQRTIDRVLFTATLLLNFKLISRRTLWRTLMSVACQTRISYANSYVNSGLYSSKATFRLIAGYKLVRRCTTSRYAHYSTSDRKR